MRHEQFSTLFFRLMILLLSHQCRMQGTKKSGLKLPAIHDFLTGFTYCKLVCLTFDDSNATETLFFKKNFSTQLTFKHLLQAGPISQKVIVLSCTCNATVFIPHRESPSSSLNTLYPRVLSVYLTPPEPNSQKCCNAVFFHDTNGTIY